MSRPGGKKRGVKSTGPGPHRKKPQLSKPFPRSVTAVVTSPGLRRSDTIREANEAWYAWLRIISNLSQMTLPPGNRAGDR